MVRRVQLRPQHSPEQEAAARRPRSHPHTRPLKLPKSPQGDQPPLPTAEGRFGVVRALPCQQPQSLTEAACQQLFGVFCDLCGSCQSPDAQSWALGGFFQVCVFGGFAVKDWKTAQPSSPWLTLRRCAGQSSSYHLLATSFSNSRAYCISLYPLGTLRLL